MRKFYLALLAAGIAFGANALPSQSEANGSKVVVTTPELTLAGPSSPSKFSGGQIPGAPHRRGGVQYTDTYPTSSYQL